MPNLRTRYILSEKLSINEKLFLFFVLTLSASIHSNTDSLSLISHYLITLNVAMIMVIARRQVQHELILFKMHAGKQDITAPYPLRDVKSQEGSLCFIYCSLVGPHFGKKIDLLPNNPQDQHLMLLKQMRARQKIISQFKKNMLLLWYKNPVAYLDKSRNYVYDSSYLCHKLLVDLDCEFLLMMKEHFSSIRPHLAATVAVFIKRGFRYSAFDPKAGLNSFLKTLNKEKFICCTCRIGEAYFESSAKYLYHLKEYNYDIYGWDTFTFKPDFNKQSYHCITIIGAQRNDKETFIFYVDPWDASIAHGTRIVYRVNIKALFDTVRPIRNNSHGFFIRKK